MAVDVKIAVDGHGNVDQAVAGELRQHVVEEADARGYVVAAGPVQINARADTGFLGRALDGGLSACVRFGGHCSGVLA